MKTGGIGVAFCGLFLYNKPIFVKLGGCAWAN